MVSTSDFPQADKITQVGDVARAVSDGNHTDISIERFIGLASDGRQGRYYRLAAQILGLVVNEQNSSSLTELGTEYASLSSDASRREFLARCLVDTKVFGAALAYIRATKPNEEKLKGWFRNFYPGQKSTADRRYFTFMAYLRDTRLLQESADGLRATSLSVGVEKQRKTIREGIVGRPLREKAEKNIETGKGQTLTVEIDLQKRERANHTHWRLVAAKAGFLKVRDMPASENPLVDLFSSRGKDVALYEMKSLSGENLGAQMRRAVAQLYEYRYIFSQPQARLCIVTNKAIPKADHWVIDYLVSDRSIAYEWTDDFKVFNCAGDSKALLGAFAP